VERGNKKAVNSICFVGDGGLPSAYPVIDCASAVTATAALAVLELLGKAHRPGANRDGRSPAGVVLVWAVDPSCRLEDGAGLGPNRR